jgi:hypothetical protein
VRIQSILEGIPGIEFIYFHPEDVVRHRLVRHIIHAFDQFHARENGKSEDGVGVSRDPRDRESATPETPAVDAPEASGEPGPSA